jgi:hypothetical protein
MNVKNQTFMRNYDKFETFKHPDAKTIKGIRETIFSGTQK